MSRRNVRQQKSTLYNFVEVSEDLQCGMSQRKPGAKGSNEFTLL